MKAIRIHKCGGPEVLRWETVPDPLCLPNQVLVQMKAMSINHLDIWVRNGLFNYPLPIIMGSDGAGVIVEVGQEVEGWKVGDAVIIQPGTYCGNCQFCQEGKENFCADYGILGETENGTQCELMALNSEQLERKPDFLSFEEAAAFPLVFLTSYTMLIRRAKIQNRETILILGAGSGVGSAAIQIAKLYNCRIIATGGDEKKLQLAKSLGADYVINHSAEIIHKRVKEITDGVGADIVFEHVGEATWNSSLKSLRRGGRLVTCGATTGANVSINLRHLFIKNLSILGSTMGDRKAFSEVVEWLAQGKIKPVVDRVFSMSEVAKAHVHIENRQQFGKVVLVPE
ncbi:MAG: zinc-binding dehydrogenase [Candidatus Marinimicrobia bacterium]|nr:zinc-binding dehydrogenase [Candidatus Neomarinimicrobiota bacterium]